MPGRGDAHAARGDGDEGASDKGTPDDEAADRVKAVLFEHIQESDAVPRLVAAGRPGMAAQDMVRACHDKVAGLCGNPRHGIRGCLQPASCTTC